MILLDTHVWVRWLPGAKESLPENVNRIIRTGGQLAVSAVSVWEAAYLARAGRVDLGTSWDEWLILATTQARVEVIPLSGIIAARAAHLPPHHRDPADRFIIATVLECDISLVSLDSKFPLYEELAGRLLF